MQTITALLAKSNILKKSVPKCGMWDQSEKNPSHTVRVKVMRSGWVGNQVQSSPVMLSAAEQLALAVYVRPSAVAHGTMGEAAGVPLLSSGAKERYLPLF